MESKALPPAKINPQKLLGGSSVSAIVKRVSVKPTTGEDNIFVIRKQVIQIKDLLNTNILLKKKEGDVKRKEGEKKRFAEKEEKLEKSKDTPKEKIKLPSVPNLGFLERIKNFIFSIVLGRIAIVLLPHLPKLSGIVDTIVKVQDTIIDWTGKILNGLVSFVDKGYEVYDQSRKLLKGVGGDGFVKVFDGFTGAVDKVIEASIIAAIAFGELSGGDGGGGPSGRPRSGFDSTGRRVSVPAQRRYYERYGRERFLERFGKEGFESLPKSMQRGSLTRFGRKAFVTTLGKGGAKAVLGTVRPLLKRLPIIGALIDFGLSVALGEDPGRAAFKAIGAGLLGSVGAAAGSVVPFAGTFLGGLAGGALGDMAGGALYDVFFGKKTPSKPKVQGRAQGGVVTRGGKLQTGPSRTVKKAVKREVGVTPTQLKPGSDVGGEKNIVKMFPKTDDTKGKNVNPLGYIKGVYDKTSKINYFGPLFGLVIKKMSGDKVDKVDYKNVGKSLNSWMSNTFGSNTMSVGGFAEGGEVNAQMFMSGEDLTNVIAKSVEETVSSKLDKVLNDLEKQLMLKPKEGEKKEPGVEETPSTSGQYSPEGIQGDIYQYLLSKGMSDIHALGIMANIHRESGFRPGVSETGGPGVGLFQYSSGGRKESFLKAVPDYKTNWRGQIDYALREPGEPGQLYLSTKFSSAQEAADWWMRKWERPAEYIQNDKGPKIHREYLASLERFRTKKGYQIPTSMDFSGIDSGTGGSMVRSERGTRISGELGRFLKDSGVGSWGSGVHQHPWFGAPGRRSGRSWHNVDRAIDIGGYWPSDQKKILEKIQEFNRKNNVRPVELLYGKPGTPESGSHGDHVHVAYRDGGKVEGLTRAILGEEGPEFVIDADSTRSLEKHYPGFLDALNKADYSGALKVLQSYASYESSAPIYVDIDESMSPVLFPVPVPTTTQIPMSLGSKSEDYMASAFKR